MDAAEELDHVLRARKGDRRALAALLRHYHRPAYRLAFALTRDVRAAIAVARSAALRARDGIRYMPEGVRFFPWLAQLVRKLVRSQRSAGAAGAAPPKRPRAEADVVELAERLQRTMDDLDPDAQAALALRIVELLPLPRIDTMLAAPPGKATALLAAARWRLTEQLGGREKQRAGHLTPEHLSENLDGALQGFRFDQVRIHLDMCDHCRLQGLRMASTNDVMRALLSHDPAEGFHEALVAFLEDRLDAKEAQDPLPADLERRVAAEAKRLDAHRWAAVRHALPRPIVTPVPIPGGETVAATPAPEEKPAGTMQQPAAGPAPPPASRPASHRPATPAGRSKTTTVRPTPASRVIGAAVAALIVLIAGLYLNGRLARSRAGDARGLSAAAPVPAGGKTLGPKPAALEAGPAAAPPAPARTESMMTPRAVTDTAAALAAKAPAARVRLPKAPDTLRREGGAARQGSRTASGTSGVASAAATPHPPASVAKPSSPPRPPSPRAPAVAEETGLLCGQIRDESGAPVVGAQVLLADLHVGAVTDRRGRFCISAPIGMRTLSVIALGFTTQRRNVTIERRTPEVTFTLRSEALEEPARDDSR